jgi:hypothetical protein
MLINNIEVKIVPKYPDYATSKCGRVFRVDTKTERALSLRGKAKAKYYYLNMSSGNVQKKINSHILVALAWVHNPNPDLYVCVNHIDGNKLNNHADNLEWVTHGQNSRHAVDTGLIKKGNLLYNSELTDEQVHEICKLLVEGFRPKDLCSKYGVSADIIRKIRGGDTYFHIRSLYEIPVNYRENFSEATVKWVCERIVEGHSDLNIVKISSNERLTVIDVKRIRHKIRYKSISDKYFS